MRKLAPLFAILLALSPAAAQQGGFQYKGITGQATTTIKSSPGYLHSITFNAPTATQVVTIYDNTAASGTKIATITVPSSPQPLTLTYDWAFWVGLTVVTATASSDLTISFR